MRSAEVRKRFLDFFEKNGHTIVSSDSLIPANDPSLLFTGAGMNQFKDFFLGIKPDLTRAASVQKCFRAGDLERVGQTPNHLTFFEMLGNFSFGDYFKLEAIRFAFDFLTSELQIPLDRLWVSVYEEDEEAFQIWTKSLHFPSERVVRCGAKENFWPSNAPTDGPNGPCGPCSEIYYDYGCCFIGKVCPDPERCSPACPCGRFVEVWNLVFTSFDRKPDGSLISLPKKNIDTGMGLERMTAVMQEKMSVFETDLFEPIIQEIVQLLRQEAPGKLELKQRACVYAVADHIRALTFLIGDGVVPSNDGRGYVLRMLLRRAARAGRGIGLTKPFLYRLVPIVTSGMESAYPELTPRREAIAKVIFSEEERFQQTLEEKIPLLREEIRKVKGGRFSAAVAARFYDTHGLSYEEILDVCREEGVSPPSHEDFEKALAELQAKSRASSAFSGTIFTKDTVQELIVQVSKATEFVGYTLLTAQAKVVGLIHGNQLVKEIRAPAEVGLILDRSPFYGEAGGQVGDVGVLQGVEGKLRVTDTQRIGNVLFHKAELLEGQIRVNDPITATVDPARRRQVAQNHTATHLLHAALRKVVGTHVVQAGSLVAPDHLRFDFSHSKALSRTQEESVELLVNEWIKMSLSVSVNQMSLEEARHSGAIALFGEKYENPVRVVAIGDVSKELCGGTHLKSSHEVGFFKLVEERSVAAGVRRVKALTDRQATTYQEEERIQSEEKEKKLAQRMKEKKMEEELQRFKIREVQGQAQHVLQTRDEVAGKPLFIVKFDEPVDHAALRSASDVIRNQEPESLTFLVDARGFYVATTGGTIQRRGITANQLTQLAREVAGGSGGGTPDLNQGRLDLSKFQEFRETLKRFFKERMENS